METNVILQGDALTQLKRIPSESIDMCMTSPPYWALRDYGTEGMIWDGDPKCEHEWQDTKTTLHYGESSFQPDDKKLNKGLNPTNTDHQKMVGGKCIKCNAWKGSLGLEPDFNLYIKHLCDIFDEVKRVLKPEGSCWVNMGDTYASTPAGNKKDWKQEGGDGLYDRYRSRHTNNNTTDTTPKPKEYGSIKMKSLCQIPSRFSIEMCNRGWILRNELIWYKPNCMPSSVKDRFTVDFEKLFFFTKNTKYYFKTQYEPVVSVLSSKNNAKQSRKDKALDVEGTPSYRGGHRNDGLPSNGDTERIKRCVWKIPPKPFKEAHFATYPPELCESPIDAGCPVGGIVLDPFSGAATTGLVALKQGKRYLGIELNQEYIEIAKRRLSNAIPS